MLRLEQLETIETEATSASADAGVEAPVHEKHRPKRLPLPDHLPRHEVIHAPPHADGCCACGRAMPALGEDVTEVLEYVPGHGAKHERMRSPCGAMAIYSAAGTSWEIMRRQGRRTR